MPEQRVRLLERYGAAYGELGLAIAFTRAIKGEDAKRCGPGWDKTRPLPDAPFGAGLLKERGQWRNPAVVLRESNLIGLECDTPEGLEQISALGLPATVTVQSSASHRLHFWFRPPNGKAEFVAFRFEKAGVTADHGRYLLVPPAIHPSGAVYRFLRSVEDTEIAVLPEKKYEELTRRAKGDRAELRERLRGDPDAKITEGKRRDSVFRFACSQRAYGLPPETILEASKTLNRERCDPPLSDDQVAQQVKGALEFEPATAPAQPAAALPRGNEPEVPPAHTWTPIDLIGTASVPPEPPTLSGVAYPGRRHVYSGEPESMKSWVALAVCHTEAARGRSVLYVDLEMGRREMLARLRSLGLEDELIREHFIYLEPDERLTDPSILADLADLLAKRQPSVVVIDAFTGALRIHGCDPNSSIDIDRFYRTVVDPLRAHGAAVVILDHLPKDTTNRGRFAIGSERKIGGADVHLGFELVAPLARGKTGRVKLVTHKDRPGYLPRPKCAEVEFVSDSDSGRITWTLHPAEPTADERPFRPTFLMERVSRHLEACREPQSRNAVEGSVKGNAAVVRLAIDTLVDEDYLTEETGARSARLLSSSRRYRQADDLTSSTSSDFVPTSSETRSSPTSSTSSVPYKGDEVERDEVDEVKPATSSKETRGELK